MVSGLKVNAFGVVSIASVVTLKVAETPPTVTVIVVVVEKLVDEVCRNRNVPPLLTVPALLVKLFP